MRLSPERGMARLAVKHKPGGVKNMEGKGLGAGNRHAHRFQELIAHHPRMRSPAQHVSFDESFRKQPRDFHATIKCDVFSDMHAQEGKMLAGPKEKPGRPDRASPQDDNLCLDCKPSLNSRAFYFIAIRERAEVTRSAGCSYVCRQGSYCKRFGLGEDLHAGSSRLGKVIEVE